MKNINWDWVGRALHQRGADLSHLGCAWLGGSKISGGNILSSKTRRFSGKAAAALRLATVAIGQPGTMGSGFHRRQLTWSRDAKAVTPAAIGGGIVTTLLDVPSH